MGGWCATSTRRMWCKWIWSDLQESNWQLMNFLCLYKESRNWPTRLSVQVIKSWRANRSRRPSNQVMVDRAKSQIRRWITRVRARGSKMVRLQVWKRTMYVNMRLIGITMGNKCGVNPMVCMRLLVKVTCKELVSKCCINEFGAIIKVVVNRTTGVCWGLYSMD